MRSPAQAARAWARSARAALRRHLHEGDADAFDEDLVRSLLPVALPLYHWYWRVRVVGVENIPTEGPAVLAANHSGTVPVDGAMLKVAVFKEHGRNVYLLASDLTFRIPLLAQLVRPTGNARADRTETRALLRRGELVGVFPEGFKGIGKGWSQRYRLQRFGRGGFAAVAIEAGCPIVPVAVVGAEETYPMIANLEPLARFLRVPYVPVTPWFPLLGPLGMLPLPSRWAIVFGEPIPTDGFGPAAAGDAEVVRELAERTRARVQRMLYEQLRARGSPFFGGRPPAVRP